MNAIATKKNRWALDISIKDLVTRLGRCADDDTMHVVSEFLKTISIGFDFGPGGDLCLSTDFEKWFEDGIPVMEVVVNDVHKIEGIHHVHDKFMGQG
jgi:hypothetical protein